MVYHRILNIVSCATWWASLIAQLVKSLSAMQETWVRFLGLEDPLEKDMATHSSIPACRNPWMEDPGRLQSIGSQEFDMTEQLSTQTHKCYTVGLCCLSILYIIVCIC